MLTQTNETTTNFTDFVNFSLIREGDLVKIFTYASIGFRKVVSGRVEKKTCGYVFVDGTKYEEDDYFFVIVH